MSFDISESVNLNEMYKDQNFMPVQASLGLQRTTNLLPNRVVSSMAQVLLPSKAIGTM
jgi:hypothetical protein